MRRTDPVTYVCGSVEDLTVLERYVLAHALGLPFNVELVLVGLMRIVVPARLRGDEAVRVPLDARHVESFRLWTEARARQLAVDGDQATSALLGRITFETPPP